MALTPDSSIAESPKNIAGSGESTNHVPLHPNQDKIDRFVGDNSATYNYRMELRDAVSYARALKCSGWKLPILEASRRQAYSVIAKWSSRRAHRLSTLHVTAVVNFVYDDPEL